ESHPIRPSDLPIEGNRSEFSAGGKTYRLTDMYPVGVGNDLDLVVRYESPNVSDTNLAYQENVAVIKAVVAKYPEFRDAFAGIIARATEPSGKDYGTLLGTKELH